MVDYDPHQWTSHLFDIRGSTIKEIFARLVVLTIWSALVVWAYLFARQYGISLSIEPAMHQMAGIALGLLLVLRTNSSYDRFWEGRKLWGGIVNDTRNLARGACTHLADSPLVRSQTILWTIAFPYAAMYVLRKNNRRRQIQLPAPDDLGGWAAHLVGPVGRRLPEMEQRALLSADHLPLHVACRLTASLRAARDEGLISDIVMTGMDQTIGRLIDELGGCERIHRTPIPYAYMVHARRVLLLYCGTLPFALVSHLTWYAVPVACLVGFIFLGIEEIGVEIEDPFGEDENDLPLERFCGTIERNLTPFLADDLRFSVICPTQDDD